MSWSFRIARIAGIELRVHVTFFLLLAWIAYAFYAQGGMPAAIRGIILIGLIFLCVVLHEFGHALAAARYGIKTPDITLLPIGGVARLQRMPDQPMQEFVVAIAGPLVNVVIAGAIYLGLGGAVRLTGPLQLDNPQVSMLQQVMVINVLLVLFNLLPAFPMDGGRVLRALLATRMSYIRATNIAASLGQFMAFMFAFWGLTPYGTPLLILIALFVYMGAAQEAAATQMREVARHSAVADAMISEFRPLPASATLQEAAEALLATTQKEFPVVDDQQHAVGLLTRDDLMAGLKERGADAPIADVMKPGVRSVGLHSSLEDAFRMMAEGELPAVMVNDRYGRLTGMVTPENVGELMMIHSALDGQRRPPWFKPADAAPREQVHRVTPK